MIRALRIDLVYDRDCPNTARARDMIRSALQQIGWPATWAEWDREDPRTPAELRDYGSPTVLVNGRDVGCDDNEDSRSDANSCRVYVDEFGRVSGAPPATLIVNAIRGAQAA
jgi:mercuric ion transport protein